MRHDAVIIGGGPAGATAALLLARAGWSVALIEQAEFPRRKVCGEFLSAATVPLLRDLGLAESFLDLAGPEIRRVGIFSGDQAVTAEMPLATGQPGWGRALGREYLDVLLLDRAAASGAVVWQPYRAIAVQGTPGAFVVSATASTGVAAGRQTRLELHARMVIDAHGSWNAGPFPTEPVRTAAGPSDLFGFKARFTKSRLQPGLMPLLAFPGGYGGMVHTDHDRISVSCCIRRDRLERCRRGQPGMAAGDAVLAHITRHCDPARHALEGAELEPDSWRSAGPIRPGIRMGRRAGVFPVGNAAGEAHPVIAEGISMALQSGQLLARCLTDAPGVSGFSRTAVEYDREWGRAFSWRIRAASVIAHWAMRPAAVSVTLPLLRAFPLVLTEGARTTGKVSFWRGHALDTWRQGQR